MVIFGVVCIIAIAAMILLPVYWNYKYKNNNSPS